jgi:hypothetical protein
MITYRLIDNTTHTVKSLDDAKLHNTYEADILQTLDNDGRMTIFNLTTRLPKTYDADAIIDDKTSKVDNVRNKYANRYVLSVNLANGSMNAKYVSSSCGKIFNDFDDVLQDWIARNVGAIKYIVFNTRKEAENCLAAMKRPLLRFALYRTQDDQSMNNKCYRYIPDIDWADDRTKTDEGILMMCGCDKEKAHEYATYCKDIIDKVDKK